MSIHLETPRLQIVTFSGEHLTERYVGWLNDPEVVRFSEQRHRRHTLVDCQRFWESFENSPNLFLAIVSKDPAAGHIGNLTVYVDPANQIADIGILIGERAVWGQGVGLEAWKAVCHYLLDTRAIRKVTAGTLSVNEGMLSIMRRSGMVEDGRRGRHYLCEGQEVDMVHFALFRSSLKGN
ncbi:hypothetical protein D3C72_59390 [compost metagenome]